MLELLKNLRVIDLTSVVLGPYATQILGDLGAEIIKIEPCAGDVFRAVRPGRSPEIGAGFLNCNRNKRSVAIDLKQAAGLEVLHTLVRKADVFVHNMRPSSAEKLGVSYHDLARENPSLVYCCAPAFGQGGPYADSPAYDDIIQAMSGLAHLNSETDGEPRFLRTIVADKVGGLHLAIAVLGGLVRRLETGQGCCVEIPMYEATVSFLMLEQLAGQSFLPPLGSTGYDRLMSPYRRPFKTRDGFIGLLPYNTKHWVDFLTLVGEHELAKSRAVTDPVERSREVNRLYKVISEITPTRTTGEWLAALQAIDVPCAPVNRMDDLFDDPHLRDVGMFCSYEHPTEGTLRETRTPFMVEGSTERANRPAPRLGQDTLAVLREAGLPEEQLNALVAGGIIVDAAE